MTERWSGRRGRALAWFVIQLAVIFTVLTVAWPLVAGAYGGLFRFGGSMIVPSFGAEASIRFQPLPDESKYVDTLVHMRNLRNGAASRMRLSARYLGYAPMSLYVALVVATPISWRRRGLALAWGLPIIAVLVGLRILLHVGEDLRAIGVIDIGPVAKFLMGLATNAVSRSTFTWFVMPVVVWVVVAFRRGDWAVLAGSREAASAEPAGGGSRSHKTRSPADRST